MTTETTDRARPFTEEDWYGWAGAEGWNLVEGVGYSDQPVIRCWNNHYCIADANGACAVTGEDGDCWQADSLHFPNQACAMAFLNGLPDDFTPQAFGFDEEV